MKSRRAVTTACQLVALASSNTARTILVRHLQSLGITICIPDNLSMTAYRCCPHERPGISGQTSLVVTSCQRIRFARLLATRFDTGHEFIRSSEWAANARTRAHAGSLHAARSLCRFARWCRDVTFE
jgi:hypothetical protein